MIGSNAVLTLLLVALSGVVQFCDASHFRYGYFYWERQLDFNPTTAGEIKIRATLDAGARWTYPFSSAAPYDPYTGIPITTTPAIPNEERCVHFYDTTNQGCCQGNPFFLNAGGIDVACPNKGALVTWGSFLQFNKPVRITALYGDYALNNPLTTDLLEAFCNVTEISASTDTFYTRQVFDMVFQQGIATAADPLTISFFSCCRISQMLDGNNDQNWNVLLTIDASPGNTKSPKSVSTPIVPVFALQNNVITIPTAAFDNLHNQFRLSTFEESSIPYPVPKSPSLFSLNELTGVINFTPRTTGFYCIQVMIVSYTSGGVEKNRVPLDFMFQAFTASSVVYTVSLSTTGGGQANGATTYYATVPQLFTFDVVATVSPINTAYTVVISYTPLPVGATQTQPVCFASTPCHSTFSWTPSVTSTAAPLQYTAQLFDGPLLIAQTNGALSVTVKLNPLETRVTTTAAIGACGGETRLSARLSRVLGDAPLNQRELKFSLDSSSTTYLDCRLTDTPTITTTNRPTTQPPNGIVDCRWYPAAPLFPAVGWTAYFDEVVNEYLAASQGSNVAVTKQAHSTLDVPTFVNPSIGYPVTVNVQMNRIFTDTGIYPPAGTMVEFTVTGPSGYSEVKTGTTNLVGVASVTFNSALPSAGSYTVVTKFSGDGCLFPNTDGSPVTSTGTFSPRRRTRLTISPIAATYCGTSSTAPSSPLVMTLVELPAGTVPVVGATLSVSLGGNGVASISNFVTNSAGQVTGSAYWSLTAPTPSVTASWNPTGNFANDQGAFAAESDSLSVTVNSATHAFTTISIPTSGQVGASYVVTLVLSRNVPNVGVVVGQAVTCNFFDSFGNLQGTRTLNTDTNGRVQISDFGWSSSGTNSVTCSASMSGCQVSPTNAVASVVVSAQATSALTLNAVNGVCGVQGQAIAKLTDAGGTILVGKSGVTWTVIPCSSVSSVTDALGQSICTYTPTAASASTSYTVNYNGADTPPRVPASASNTYTVRKANTALTQVGSSTSTYLLGNGARSYTVQLNTNEGSVVALNSAGLTITFTVTAPSGATQTLTPTTGSNGQATLSFTPTEAGVYAVTAAYNGLASTCYNTASTLTLPSFTSYQRVALSFSPTTVGGVCRTDAAPANIVAVLTATQTGAAPISPAATNVPVSIGYGAPGSPFTVNSVGNTATLAVQTGFASPVGGLALTATISATTANTLFLADSTGAVGVAISAAAGATLDVTQAATTLTLISPTTSSTVGSVLSFTAELLRTSAPAVALSGQSVTFELNGPSGLVTRTDTTISNGRVTVQFPALTSAGSYTIIAKYNPAAPFPITAPSLRSCTAPVNSASSNLAVTSNLNIVLSAAAGQTACGSPFALTATVTTLPSGTPVSDPLVVTITSGALSCQGTLSSGGVATCSLTFPASSGSAVTAQAAIAAQGIYSATSSNVLSFAVNSAATGFGSLLVVGVDNVGETVQIQATLSRTASPAGVLNNAPVVITVTGPAENPGLPQVFNRVTDASGAVTANLPLNVKGVFEVVVNYAGDSCLAASSRNADFTVYQKTYIVANTAHGVCTDPTVVTAGLYALPSNAPIGNQLVTFDFAGVVSSGTATTDASGIASVTRTFNTPGSYALTVSFSNLAAYFLDENGASIPTDATSTVEISQITTSVTTPSFVPQAVGDGVTVVTVLARVTVPTGPLSGRSVTFSLDGHPDQSVATDSAGHAEASFTLTTRGTHTATIAFAGDACLKPVSTSTTFLVRQRVALTAAQPTSGVCGVPTSLTGSLVFVPGGASLANGQLISFATSPATPASTSATTNAGGVATVSVTYSSTGSFPFTASFAAQNGDFLNHNGVPAVEESQTNAVIASAVSALTTAAVTSGTAYTDVPVTVTSSLSRVTSPGNGAWTGTVTFRVVAPSGASVDLPVTTDAAGVATKTFTPTERGVYSITAKFAGDSCQAAVDASTASVNVYQKVNVLARLSGASVCGVGTTVEAVVTTVPTGNALSNVGTVQFSTSVSGVGPSTTAVNGLGIASTVFNLPQAQTVQITARFVRPAGLFADRNGLINTDDVDATSLSSVTVTAPTGVFSLVTIANGDGHAFIGASVPVSSRLARVDNGAPLNGASIVYVVTEPDGNTVSLSTVTTSSSGDSSTTFVATKRGSHSVVATYAGNGCVLPVTSSSATVTLFQRTSFVAPVGVTAACGAGLTYTVQLLTTPGLAGVAGKDVVFAFTDAHGPVYSQTVQTNSAGGASVTNAFAEANPALNVRVYFSDPTSFYADSTGAFPIVPTIQDNTVAVTASATTLTGLTIASQGFVADEITVSALLTRTTAPAGGAVGETVAFTVTDPNSVTNVYSGSAVTTTGGAVSYKFRPLVKGVYSITAAFSTGVCLTASNAAAVTTSIYQRVTLTLPASGTLSTTCGASNPIDVTAVLTAVPAGYPSSGPINNAEIRFLFTAANGDEAVDDPQPVNTDALGLATTTVTIDQFVGWSPVTAQATFNGAFYHLQGATTVPTQAVASTEITVTASTSFLSQPVVTPALVGASFQYATRLTVPANVPLSRHRPIHFVLFNEATPNVDEATADANTDNNGDVQINFTPTTKGVHRVRVSSVGGSCATTATATSDAFNVYQRVTLTVVPVSAVCEGVALNTVTAELLTLPGGLPIDGETVTFSFTGTQAVSGTSLAQPDRTAVTSGGIATLTDVVFPTSGSVTLTASFLDAANFYTNSAGSTAPVVVQTATNTATIAVALTEVTISALPDPAYYVDSPIPTLTATLTRLTAPNAGPVPNFGPITIVDAAPGGTFSYGPVNTNAAGQVVLPLSALVPGHTYVFRVSYGPTNPQCLQASSLDAPQFAVWIPAVLTLTPTPATITCGISPIVVGAVVSNLPPTGFAAPTGAVSLTVAPSGQDHFQASRTLGGSETGSTSFANFPSAFDVPGLYTITGTYVPDSKHTNSARTHPPQAEVKTTQVLVTTQTPNFVGPPALSTGDTAALAGDFVFVDVIMYRDDGGYITEPIKFTFTGPNGVVRVVNNVFADASGLASVPVVLWERGTWSVVAESAVGACMTAATSPVGTFDIYTQVDVTLDAPTVLATCGVPTPIKAILTANPAYYAYLDEELDGSYTPTGLSGVTVEFSFSSGSMTTVSAVTDANAEAAVSVQFPDGGSVTVTATVVDPTGNFLTDASRFIPLPYPLEVQQLVVGAEIPTTFSALSVAATGLTGAVLPVSVSLSTGSGAVANGNQVLFTLTPPTGQGLIVATNSVGTTGGVATWNIPANLLGRGDHTIRASFAKSGCLGGSFSALRTVRLYEKTQLVQSPLSPICGAPFTRTATLTRVPANVGLAGQSVGFDFAGALAFSSLTTDASGVATYSGAFTTSGPVTATNTFTNAPAFYTNHLGDIPSATESVQSVINVVQAAATVATPSLSVSAFYPNEPLQISSTLLRASAPSGPLQFTSVKFHLTRAGDPAWFVDYNGITAADGTTSVFVAGADLTAVDLYTIVASYTGSASSCVASASSTPLVVQMRQRTLLKDVSIVGGNLCGNDVVFRATLVADPDNGAGLSASVVGLPVRFTGAGTVCTANTGANGIVSCTARPTVAGNNQNLRVEFLGNTVSDAATPLDTLVNVAFGNTAISAAAGYLKSVVGPSLTNPHVPLISGQANTLAATLKSNTFAVVGRSLTWTIGVGGTAQTCTGVTDANGAASCQITVSGQPFGINLAFSVGFTADTCFSASTTPTAATTAWKGVVFTYPSVGSFAVGDVTSPSGGASRTFASAAQNWYTAQNGMTADLISPAAGATQNTNWRGYGKDVRKANGTPTTLQGATCGDYFNQIALQPVTDYPLNLDQWTVVPVVKTLAYDPGTVTTNDCASNPCQFGAPCSNNYGGGYYCACASPRSGAQCQNPTGYVSAIGAGSRLHGTTDPKDGTAQIVSLWITSVSQFIRSTPFGLGTLRVQLC